MLSMLVIYSLWFSDLNWELQPLMCSLWQKKCRKVINFLFNKVAKEIFGDMPVTLGEKSLLLDSWKLNCSTWGTIFQHWKLSPSRKATCGHSAWKYDTVHSMALADQRISTRNIAQTLDISRERVGFIIHDVLEMKKLSVKLVPKCLNANQKRDRFVGSQVILVHFRRNTAGFLAQLVTMNETWYVFMTQRQKNNIRSGDTMVQLFHKNFEHSSQPPTWQHLISGTKLVYCWSTKSKRVQQSQKATTYLSWVKWRRKRSLNGGEAVKIV
jgi:hypothetical protein